MRLHDLEAEASDLHGAAQSDNPRVAESAQTALQAMEEAREMVAAFEERRRLILRGMARATDEAGGAA